MNKDLGIRLFGRKIPVPESQIQAKSEIMDCGSQDTRVEAEGPRAKVVKWSDEEDGKKERQTPKTVNGVQANLKLDKDQVEANSTDQGSGFKKPDKVIPCPRCNSLETKFCYFNNYHVNQPRHFCKNCQRYWTAGGAMRNVPVGAGRRKNRHLASQYQQILLSSNGIPNTRTEIPYFVNHQFPSSDQSATASFFPSKSMSVETGEDGVEPSCTSSITASSVHETESRATVSQTGNDLSLQQPVHYYPVNPWLSPISPGWNNIPSMAAAQWCATPVLAVPEYCPPSIPLQIVPASFCSRMPLWTAGIGTMPLAQSKGCISPLSPADTDHSGNDLTTLGKHSRDSDKCILSPKTLRFGDPNEAARSPIWVSLGIKPDRKDLITKGTIFRAFEPEPKDNDHPSNGAQVLEGNPAAHSIFPREHIIRCCTLHNLN